MSDELSLIAVAVVTAALVIAFYEAKKKTWYLETLNPREHYELGKEKKLIVNLTINKKVFHGVEVGKYKLLLMHGTTQEYARPLLHGKLEQAYMAILAESLVGRKLVSRVEKARFFHFIFERIPALKVRGYVLTAEMVSPQDVLDMNWEKQERDKATQEMMRRNLISNTVLWLKPYPKEGIFAEIMRGAIGIPDIIMNDQQEFTKVTATFHETIIKMNQGIAQNLQKFLPLARTIVTSISDSSHVIALILADRAKKIEGLGIEQLAEHGSMDGILDVSKKLKAYEAELAKVFGKEFSPEEIKAIQDRLAEVEQIKKTMADLTEKVNQIGKQTSAPVPKT